MLGPILDSERGKAVFAVLGSLGSEGKQGLLCWELSSIPPGQTGPLVQVMFVLRDLKAQDILQLKVSLVPTASADAF